MARILLAHSFFLRFDAKAWRQMRPYPPLGTLYAAAVLREAGHEVALFDAMLASDERDIRPSLESHRPDIVLFHEDSFNYLSKMCLTRMREACFRMTAEARRSGAVVIAQGSDPVDHLADYFAHGIDAVIIGEGEETAVELVGALIPPAHDRGGQAHEAERCVPAAHDHAPDLDRIAGIAFPSAEGPVVTGRRALIRDLDRLPFPAWDLVDMDAYRSAWRRHGMFSLNIVTTRGCPYHCTWCAKPVYGQAYHSRSPESVAAELAMLRDRYAPDHIWFCDDILGLTPGWLAAFADLVEGRVIRTPFTCQTRADLMMRENNVANIARAGAQTVWIGAESGAQPVLDAMRKGITIEQIHGATRGLQAHGVHVAWFLQFGYPGEGAAEIAATRRMLREGRPDDIGISVSYPLPGTPFYESVRQALGAKRNWTDSGDLDLMFPGAFPPAFYRALHAAVHRGFRLRQGLRALLHPRTGAEALRRIALIPWNLAQLALAHLRMLRIMRTSPMRGMPRRARVESLP